MHCYVPVQAPVQAPVPVPVPASSSLWAHKQLSRILGDLKCTFGMSSHLNSTCHPAKTQLWRWRFCRMQIFQEILGVHRYFCLVNMFIHPLAGEVWVCNGSHCRVRRFITNIALPLNRSPALNGSSNYIFLRKCTTSFRISEITTYVSQKILKIKIPPPKKKP